MKPSFLKNNAFLNTCRCHHVTSKTCRRPIFKEAVSSYTGRANHYFIDKHTPRCYRGEPGIAIAKRVYKKGQIRSLPNNETKRDIVILDSLCFSKDFLLSFFSIIVIDLILAGDNAVVIAMAVQSLPKKQRMKGIAFGAGFAVMLRVSLTFFAAQLLQLQYVKFVGGVLIFWIAVKLFIEGVPEEGRQREVKTFWHAIWLIVIADITMSTDNILAIAAASAGNLWLLIFGLGLSIPLVVFTSTILSTLMERYPIIIYIGAAILGRVGGEMIMTDPIVVQTFHPSAALQYGVEALCIVGVIVTGKYWGNMKAFCQDAIIKK